MRTIDPVKHHDLFDHLRLFAAGIVLWTHHYGLTGGTIPFCEPLNVNYGVVGVYIFFAVSGYLNTLSLERWKSATSFLVARAVRIYPALIACVVVTVLLCAAATTVDLTDYFLSRDTVKYLAYNSTMLRGFVVFELPGVFTSNPVPKVVNGSLWTLPIEAMAYVLFAVSMSAVRFKREMPVFLLTVGIVGLVVSNKMYSSADIQVVFAKFWLAFLAGASIASLLDRGLLVAVIHISAVAAILFLLQCAMLALLLLLVAATVAIGSISIPARYALPLDISYGFYLYAWPIQQIGVQLFGDFWRSLAFSVCGTAAMGLLSCVLIERPARAFHARHIKMRLPAPA